MVSKAQVLARLKQALELKGRDWKTVDSYCCTAGKFYDYTLKCPAEWSSEKKAEEYLTMRVRRDNVSPSTQNHDLAAINALYASRGRKLGNVDALRAKRSTHQRHCPTKGEILQLLGALHDTPQIPARLIALYLYGCGLRVNEGLDVRLKDVRLSEGKLVLQDTKHGNSRVTILPPMLHEAIRRQMDYAKLVFAQDQERNPPLPLQIPHALARKYPKSPHWVGWAFLFPSPKPLRTPRTGQMVRWHLPDWSVQQAFAQACDEAGLVARITPHCLRHGFGTHFEGDIRDLQALMGHKSLETTQGYRHPQIDRAKSPLETLGNTNVVHFPSHLQQIAKEA